MKLMDQLRQGKRIDLTTAPSRELLIELRQFPAQSQP